MKPLISIVIPNYNSAPTLDRAIRSILDQNYPSLQLIVVDSCSTDGSLEILERYRHQFAELIIEKDEGQADGLNKGFRKATGDIFGWLCSDDELTPGTLDYVAETFTANPTLQFLTGQSERLFPDGTSCLAGGDPETREKIVVQNCIEQPSTFWRAECHRAAGELDNWYKLGFDWEFWCRILTGGAEMKVTDRVLSKYYFSATNKSSNAGRQFVIETTRLMRRYGPLRGWLPVFYRFLYFRFDMKGCFDKPPTCSFVRWYFFLWTLSALHIIIGRRLVNLYNWHFAAMQERGLKWWA